MARNESGRQRTNGSSRLRESSAYIHIARGEVASGGTDIWFDDGDTASRGKGGRDSVVQQFGLAMLEADLTIALVDAKGRVVQPLKRFVRHKNRTATGEQQNFAASFLSNSGSFLSSGGSLVTRSTIRGTSAAAKQMVATQCSANNFVPSQKTLFQLLTTANVLQPPFQRCLAHP